MWYKENVKYKYKIYSRKFKMLLPTVILHPTNSYYNIEHTWNTKKNKYYKTYKSDKKM